MCQYVALAEPQITKYSNLTTLLSMYGIPKNDNARNFWIGYPATRKESTLASEVGAYFTLAHGLARIQKLYERVKEEIEFYGID